MKSLILMSAVLCFVSTHAMAATGSCVRWYDKKTNKTTSYQCSLNKTNYKVLDQCKYYCGLLPATTTYNFQNNKGNVSIGNSGNLIQSQGNNNRNTINAKSTAAGAKGGSDRYKQSKQSTQVGSQNYAAVNSADDAKNYQDCDKLYQNQVEYQKCLKKFSAYTEPAKQKAYGDNNGDGVPDLLGDNGNKDSEKNKKLDPYKFKGNYVSEQEKKLYGDDGKGGYVNEKLNQRQAANDRVSEAQANFSDRKAELREMKSEGVKELNGKRLYSYQDEKGVTKFTDTPVQGDGKSYSLVSKDTKVYAGPDGLTSQKTEGYGEIATGTEKISREEKKQLKEDARQQMKEEKTAAREEYEKNKLTSKEKREKAAVDNGAEIREENETKSYGGKYGGYNVETTKAVNEGVKVLSTITSTLAANEADSKNTSINSNMAMQGSAATQKQMNDSQADMMDNSADSTKKLGKATVIMGALQGAMTYFHANSISKVNSAASMGRKQVNSVRDQIEADYAACASNPAKSISDCEGQREKYMAQADAQEKNVRVNHKEETNAQKNAIVNQGIATATTIAQGALQLKQAKTLHNMADELRKRQFADENSFAFNPNAVPTNTNPEVSAVEASYGELVAEDETGAAAGAADDEFNPNIADAGAGPAPAPNNMADPKGPPGATGSGMGAAGSTSAAKDDAKGEAVAQGKTASGTYSAGEGAGSRFSRSGGSGGGPVGIDSIGDLLKKFLPDGESEARPEDNLAFDRTPANDQAAVLGRNQNIFEAIHKRYQKKHTEGAIVFSGDQG